MMADSSLGLLRGEGEERAVSSSSLMDIREEFRDRTEDRLVVKEFSREGMGVGTFSVEGRDLRAGGVAFGVYMNTRGEGGSNKIMYKILIIIVYKNERSLFS